MPAPVFAILSADAGVSALVGTRIYPQGLIPQEVSTASFPVLTYQTVTGTTENVLSGNSSCDYERVQIDCWGVSLASAQQVSDAVRVAFENFSAFPSSPKCSVLLSTFNGHDFQPDTKRSRVSTDWDFWILR